MRREYLAQELKSFRSWLLARDKAEGTVKQYIHCVRRFLTEFHEDIGEMKLYLRKRSDSTGNSFKCAIKLYYKFKNIDVDPELLKPIRVRDSKRNIIDRELVPGLVASVRPHHRAKNKLKWRNYSVISLIAFTGIRPLECSQIKVQDVNFIEESIWIKGVKREESRQIFPPIKVLEAIKRYIELASKLDSELLFEISPSRIHTIVKGETGFPPKDFRTTFGTEVAIQTKDPYMVMKLMGHRDISSSMPYLVFAEDLPRKIKEVVLYGK